MTELELLSNMFDVVKKNKKNLIALKNMAVKIQQFEFASKLRELEKQLFPLTEENKSAIELGEKSRIALGMAGIKCTDQQAYIIYQTMNLYLKKDGQFSLDDGCKIKSDSEEYFLFDE